MADDRTALERLQLLACRDPIAHVALEMHRAGTPLADCLIASAEVWSGKLTLAQLEDLDRLIERPPVPVILVTSEAERDRIKQMLHR